MTDLHYAFDEDNFDEEQKDKGKYYFSSDSEFAIRKNPPWSQPRESRPKELECDAYFKRASYWFNQEKQVASLDSRLE